MERESLLNDIPNTAAVLALLIAGVEILMQLAGSGALAGAAGIGWRADTVTDFGFFPAVQHEMFARGLFVPEFLWRYVTYPFIHSGFTHAFFAMAIVLALGKFVGERWHWASMLSVFVIPSIVAAMVFGAVAPENWPLYGAYPPIYGLIGAFSYMMWMRLGQTGQNRWRAFSMIGMLLIIQVMWGLMLKIFAVLGMGGDATPMVFYVGVADMAGFFAGLLLSPLVGPGGWAAFVNRIRQRSD